MGVSAYSTIADVAHDKKLPVAETQETLSKTLRTTMCRYDDEVIDWLWGHIVEYKKFVSKSQYTK